jgi:hypothetical protein
MVLDHAIRIAKEDGAITKVTIHRPDERTWPLDNEHPLHGAQLTEFIDAKEWKVCVVGSQIFYGDVPLNEAAKDTTVSKQEKAYFSIDDKKFPLFMNLWKKK